MIAFVINQSIINVMTDYLNHLKWYLQANFNLESEIIYTRDKTQLCDPKYTIVIFVQRVDVPIITMLTGIPDTATYRRPPANPRAQFRSSRSRTLAQTPAQTLAQTPAQTPTTKKLYILNTEQATLERHIGPFLKSVIKYKLPVIDYSLENISLLQKRLPPTIPLIHWPFPPNFAKASGRPKTTAVVSLQSSQHRKNVCNALKRPIQNFLGMWGERRDAVIRNSRVLINLHYDPSTYRIFESIRCYHALEMRTLVISEPGIANDKVLLYDAIIFCPIDKLVETLATVLENYEEYYQRYFSPERIAAMESKIKNAFEATIDEFGFKKY